MKTIQITVHDSSYPIHIGVHLVEKLSKIVSIHNYSKVLILTDEHIPESVVSVVDDSVTIESHIFSLPSGETNKILSSVERIWQVLYDKSFDRKSVVINLGGGMIGDMGGFAASTYMRGIDFIQVPTTLLSMVDASVGGKTGINFMSGKNIIGTFQQPAAVIIDVSLLSSLPKREFLSGFAEIIKHGIITDKAYFNLVTSKQPHEFSFTELESIITRSCEIKAQIVMGDEKETGERKLLNFGHTIGHAIESLSHTTQRPLLHGEAVSIGMSYEADIARQTNLLSQNAYAKIISALRHAHLPIKTDFAPNILLPLMKKDKKNTSGVIQWTLITDIGQALYDQIVPDEIVISVLKGGTT